MANRGAHGPLLKWVGGKHNLANRIAQEMPPIMTGYHEPFAGGAAVFMAIRGRTARAMLSDAAPELMATYEAVRDRPEGVIKALRGHERNHHEEAYYYAVRDDEEPVRPEDIAARMLYLNRAGYNGLYRTNQQGRFNVARGKVQPNRICDPNSIRAWSIALQGTTLSARDFSKTEPAKGDVIYCDPPQHGGYDRYTPAGFKERDQERLRDQAVRWARAGAVVIMTNSDTPVIRSLYAGDRFTISPLDRHSSVQPQHSGRGAQNLLIIRVGKADGNQHGASYPEQ